MNRLLVFLFLTVGSLCHSPLTAQRISKIKQITHSRWREQPDTTIIELVYQDTLLTAIQHTRGTKQIRHHTLDYKKSKVLLRDQKGKLSKSWAYGKDARLTEYYNDPYDQYEFTYQADNRIQRIDRTDKIDKYESANEFIYEGGRLVRMKTWNKKADRSASTDYVISYADGKVDQVVWGNHIRSYELDWSDDQVSSVLFSQNKDAHTKNYFSYDPSGNISEQREYAVMDGEEKIQSEYFITYQDQAGNDELIFDLYHWQYNLILGIKTFSPFQQQRY